MPALLGGAAPMSRPEQQIQRAVFEHFNQRRAAGVFCFHVPNGGYRRKAEAAIMKGLGVVAGVPDVVAIKDGRAFFLELKPEGGRLTEKQQQALIALREAGAQATHAHGLDQALRVLEGWGLLKGQTQ
jgi:VRR-NUC domain